MDLEDDRGRAGGSARREHERRRALREERVRARHPRLGGALLAMTGEPTTTAVWETGAVGEEAVGRRLDAVAGPRLAVLHDRRIRGTRANIDHLVVTSSAVWVVDSKRYRNRRPTMRAEGGLLRPRVERLFVGGRDRTALVEGVLRQVERVSGTVGPEVPVRAALCFVDADWPVIGGHLAVRGVRVVWPRRLVKEITAQDAQGMDVGAVATELAAAFPPHAAR
ncbi:NERD domain-containing protein [Nocardioides anomalus]|uniref:NERD domain-containing protein n=1 Tax=Nocardioides anomalus TaxID=2712223 RepID=A0A6G6WET9_9ACTN|nr:nuclease-related domain-containing protein [Nocardioides anomalus]QIG43848.1 NERD domain-containing protein [Nocardioides anomalus]